MHQERTYVVQSTDGGTPSKVLLNGTSATLNGHTLALTPTERHGVYLVSGVDVDIPVYVESDGIDHITLHMRGYAYRARVLHDQHHQLVAILESSPAMQTRVVKITAPMPGLLKSIFVADGEHVAKGQTLFTLEAMKMENSIAASHAGTVRNLTAKEGLAVEKGAPLCVIEPA